MNHRACAAGLLALALLASPPAAAESERTGEQLYRSACAACHGADGRGAPVAQLGFAEPSPPDFSDCSFATREPEKDWATVVRRGGPARAFDERMPAFGAILSDAEIRQTLGHVYTFCKEPEWPRGELNFPRAMFTEKAFPEDEAVLQVGAAAQGPGKVSSKLVFETRLGARSQFELVVPFALQDLEAAGGGWKGGIGDVAVGLKSALLVSHRTGTIASITGELITPTGNPDRGFGKGTFVFEPFVSLGQRLGPAGYLQAMLGVELPFDKARAENEAYWRLVWGRSFSLDGGRPVTPMLEVLGARALEEDAATSWDLVPQVQVALSTRQHVLGCIAVRVPVEPGNDRAIEAYVYVLWDWFDGGLFEGW